LASLKYSYSIVEPLFGQSLLAELQSFFNLDRRIQHERKKRYKESHMDEGETLRFRTILITLQRVTSVMPITSDWLRSASF